MRRITCVNVLMAFALGSAIASYGCCISPHDDAKQLIAQLNDASFDRRQEAERKLRELGLAALPDLEHAAGSSDKVSISSVCMGLIVELFESENVQSRKAAKAALTRLANSKSELVSQPATLALARPPKELLTWIEKTMKGVVVRDPALAGNPIVEVKLDRTRGIDPGFLRDILRNEDIGRLKILKELHTLTLENRPNIHDTVFEYLANVPQLRNVNLSRTAVTGIGFVDLPSTSNIENLDLSYCIFLDESQLKELARLPVLKTIVLDSRGKSGESDELWRQRINRSTRDQQTISQENSHMEKLRGGVGDRGIENLCGAAGLQEVSLTCTQITDQALGQLAGLSNLRSLKLDRTAVTDSGIELLEKSDVEEISLAFTFVSDECIQSLSKLQNLRRLNLNSTAISGEGIELLGELPNLEYINLAYTRVNDKHMEALAQLQNLKELDLRNTYVTLAGLLKFAEINPNFSLPQLVKIAGLSKSHTLAEIRELSLRGQKLPNSSLVAIGQFHHLESLNLSQTSIADEQLDHLKNLSKLKSLDLSSTNITDEGIARLDSLGNLESIRTIGSKITFSAMRKLFCDQFGKSPLELIEAGQYRDGIINNQVTKKLRVDLVHRGVADDDLAALAELTDIYSLKLAGNPITDKGMVKLSSESEIELIWISGKGITGASLQHLANLRRLKTLWVTDAAIDNDALRFLADFKTLENLNLCGCSIDDHGIDQLAQLSSLQTLLVNHNAFSKEGLGRLKTLQPDLEIIRSTQGITRLVSEQPTLYQFPPQYLSGSSSNGIRGGRDMDHPLQRIFGKEFFWEIQTLALPDEFDCTCLIGLESVNNIYFGEHIVREGALSSINRLPELKNISLYRSYVDDDELRHLSGMTQLEKLNLARSTVTNEGLKHLRGLTGLKSMTLGGNSNRLSPGFVTCLDEMLDLQELDLGRAPVTDESLQHIVKFDKLQTLKLREAPICEGVKLLSELSHLEEIDLGGTFITDKELKLLASLKLKSLSIDNTFVSEAGVQEFKQASPKTRLSEGRMLSDEMLEIVEPLRQKRMRVGRNGNHNVRSLNLRKEELDPETVDLLGQLSELEEISIAGDVSDNLIQILADKQVFKSLSISRGSISKSQLERLHKIPSFNSLNLYECKITPEALDVIGGMTQLQQLSLYKTQIDGQTVNDRHVESLKNLKSLTWLNLNDTEITDEALRTIESFPKLQRLFLNRTRVTDDGVYPVTRWPQLSELTAVGTKVTRNDADYGMHQVETRSFR